MDVTLVAFKSDGARKDFRVRGDRFTIGRQEGVDLRIPFSTVSRNHCEVVIENGSVLVRDLGSSNGTFLNDVRIQETSLAPGDRLTVGPVVLTIQIDGDPAEIEPVYATDGSSGTHAFGPSLPEPSPDGQDRSDSSDDSSAGIDLDDAKPAKPAEPSKPAASDGDDDEEDPLGKMISESGDDSSVFDFDFFSDDEDEADDLR